MKRLSRRKSLKLALAAAGSTILPRTARAFGEAGAFNPRLLLAGIKKPLERRESGLGRWSYELVRRTSAPARLVVGKVDADRAELYSEPFAVWAGDADPGPLSGSELRALERFFRLGGVLLVDDSAPETGVFGRAARRELARVLPDSPPVKLDPKHLVYRTFYMLKAPVGRVAGPGRIDAIVRGKSAVVLFLSVDLLGALAKAGDAWAFPVEPGGSEQREQAIRLAVNIAMYVLCSDYKDDQVHAEWLMRRRQRR
jgi:hypothetical protein